jgi:hypothetical protein
MGRGGLPLDPDLEFIGRIVVRGCAGRPFPDSRPCGVPAMAATPSIPVPGNGAGTLATSGAREVTIPDLAGLAEGMCHRSVMGTHLDTASAWNGVATSSSPFQSLSQGDEDIAAPFPVSNGGSVKMRPCHGMLKVPASGEDGPLATLRCA